MHPRSIDKPSQAQLSFPLLEALDDLGGRAPAIDVAAALAARFNLAPTVTAETTRTRDGQTVNVWRRYVRFARERCKTMGFVGSDGARGAWTLTDLGRESLRRSRPVLVLEVVRDPQGRPHAARVTVNVGLPTEHLIVTGDSRNLSWIDDGTLPLIVTSVPYFDLKQYAVGEGQLSDIAAYDEFLDGIDAIVRECQRVLAPGGRLAVNVGDVLRSRKQHGEHHVLPLHAEILVRSTRAGLRSLTGVIWAKKANCSYEQGAGGVLGTPGMPNGVIKAELEHILLFRKPGPYRSVSRDLADASRLSKEEYARYFRPIWDDVPGASTRGGHPAPFPIEIPYRLTRMFSFVGDPVLDVCAGSGTTGLAAAKAGRHSILVDAAREYTELAARRLARADRELAASG